MQPSICDTDCGSDDKEDELDALCELFYKRSWPPRDQDTSQSEGVFATTSGCIDNLGPGFATNKTAADDLTEEVSWLKTGRGAIHQVATQCGRNHAGDGSHDSERFGTAGEGHNQNGCQLQSMTERRGMDDSTIAVRAFIEGVDEMADNRADLDGLLTAGEVNDTKSDWFDCTTSHRPIVRATPIDPGQMMRPTHPASGGEPSPVQAGLLLPAATPTETGRGATFGLRALHVLNKCIAYIEHAAENDVDGTTPEEARELLKEIYQLKKRYNSPMLMYAHARHRRFSLTYDSKVILKQWFNEHIEHPYPTQREKEVLAKQTNLSLKQINDWFTNYRKRHWESHLADLGYVPPRAPSQQ